MIGHENIYPIPQPNTNVHNSNPFQTFKLFQRQYFIVNQTHAHLSNKYSKKPPCYFKANDLAISIYPLQVPDGRVAKNPWPAWLELCSA